MIANVAVADLDADGLADIVAADAAANRVTWPRQRRPAASPSGRSPRCRARPTSTPSTSTRDGDLDLAVASLGVLFPNNARSAPSCCWRTTAASASPRTSCCDDVPRVADVRPATSTATALSTCRWPCSATTRARRAGCATPAAGASKPHAAGAVGAINAEIADVDGDRNLDIVTLVSQEWEEIYVDVNDGRGRFTPPRIFGASNEDFGSSWISLADLDADGDPDVVYSNGDAFDYATTGGPQLERRAVAREHRRRGVHLPPDRRHPGASSPQAADLDGDGDLDIAVVSAYNNWADPAAQSLVWLENDGRARFTLRDVAARPPTWSRWRRATSTGDGRPDLVTGGMHMSWPYDRLSRAHGVDRRVARRAHDSAACRCGASALVAAAALAAGSAPAWLAQRRQAARLPAPDAAGASGRGDAGHRGRRARRGGPRPAASVRRAGLAYHASQRPAARGGLRGRRGARSASAVDLLAGPAARGTGRRRRRRGRRSSR